MAASRRRLSLRVVEAGDGTPGGSDDQPRPEVHLVQGRRFDAIEEAERHLVQRDRNLFQHAGRVVCVGPQRLDLGGGVKVDGLCIVEVTNEQMRLRFNRACDIRKFERTGSVSIAPRISPRHTVSSPVHGCCCSSAQS